MQTTGVYGGKHLSERVKGVGIVLAAYRPLKQTSILNMQREKKKVSKWTLSYFYFVNCFQVKNELFTLRF